MRYPWLLLLLLAVTPARAEGPDDLARELSRLRAETESLSERIARALDDRRVRLRGLAEQRTVAEGERRRETQRRDELKARLDKVKAQLGEAAEREAALGPAVEVALAALRQSVAASIPFRRTERLAALDALAARLKSKEALPSQTFARLWEAIEDERRLTREVGRDRQVVVLDGAEHLVDVLRIGMAMLYYRANDGRMGQAVFREGTWRFEAMTDEAQRQRLEAVFTSFERRVTTGFFSLPILNGGLR